MCSFFNGIARPLVILRLPSSFSRLNGFQGALTAAFGIEFCLAPGYAA